jgi:hypothetical protein
LGGLGHEDPGGGVGGDGGLEELSPRYAHGWIMPLIEWVSVLCLFSGLRSSARSDRFSTGRSS